MKSAQLKRRPHSKSRYGCKTCKRRRVKCDETHPVCNNCRNLQLECSYATKLPFPFVEGGLNILDIRLFYHYTTVVWKTIVAAGISNEAIWKTDVPEMAFEYPFLMHAVLTFSANHFSRIHCTEFGSDTGAMDAIVTLHRGNALRLLGEAVRNVTPQNLDALVASSILLILDSMANASPPDSTSGSSLPASAWLHHVRGAATIFTAIGPPSRESRFYHLVNIDLSDLAIGLMGGKERISGSASYEVLECFDDDLKELYPVSPSSPYYHALCYLNKLFHQRYKSDFILRVFSLPALLDKNMIQRLVSGDLGAKKIVKVYYKLVRSYTSEMKQSVWFLEGVSKILPIDMDQELGGFGFIAQALPITLPTMDQYAQTISEEKRTKGELNNNDNNDSNNDNNNNHNGNNNNNNNNNNTNYNGNNTTTSGNTFIKKDSADKLGFDAVPFSDFLEIPGINDMFNTHIGSMNLIGGLDTMHTGGLETLGGGLSMANFGNMGFMGDINMMCEGMSNIEGNDIKTEGSSNNITKTDNSMMNNEQVVGAQDKEGGIKSDLDVDSLMNGSLHII